MQVGDYVMKTVEGVCRVDQELMMRAFDNSGDIPYFLLIPLKDARSRVYVRQAERYEGIRPVMTKGEAESLMGRISAIDAVAIEDDKLREPTYKDALRSLDPDRIVSIIKCMRLHGEERLRIGKKRTSLDERYSKLAEETLIQELAFALEEEQEVIRDRVRATENA